MKLKYIYLILKTKLKNLKYIVLLAELVNYFIWTIEQDYFMLK